MDRLNALNTQELFRSLQPELEQLDQERVNTKQELGKNSLICLPFVLAGVGTFIWGIAEKTDALGYVGAAVGLLAYVGWSIRKIRINKEFARSYKEKVIGKIIKKIDPSFGYNPERIDLQRDSALVTALKKSQLFPSFERGNSEDAITGTIKENQFEFREITLETSGKHSKVVFHGIMINVYLKTGLPSPLYILPDSANQLKDSLWKMLNLKSKRGEVVVLDHESFEKLFKVYAEDSFLATSLLRRSILDRMVMIHEKVSAINPVRDSIRLAFVDNAITISIRLKVNLFEPRLSEPINDQAYFERNVAYLALFLGLIEDLNLSG